MGSGGEEEGGGRGRQDIRTEVEVGRDGAEVMVRGLLIQRPS